MLPYYKVSTVWIQDDIRNYKNMEAMKEKSQDLNIEKADSKQ